MTKQNLKLVFMILAISLGYYGKHLWETGHEGDVIGLLVTLIVALFITNY